MNGDLEKKIFVNFCGVILCNMILYFLTCIYVIFSYSTYLQIAALKFAACRHVECDPFRDVMLVEAIVNVI